ncbi:hypothetical protein [Saccharopolyspora sp. 6V]|uniref:hypothetical protein n=1 Tax=Saccharopolyspora sp. 6V TaxID=2877239 RepID=UPI001CD1D004|nr:hypothetical protein [Saccharopolyspora sp. 6V]MCA1195129.1 hypothetical protein [Saccharopolyspora sp. 6V]
MRVYATPEDLTAYAGTAPADAVRLLARASEDVDHLLILARYTVDSEGYPTDPAVRDALKRATCAVVQWWDETGDTTGAASVHGSVQIGTLRLQGSGAAPDDASRSPAAVRILATAGLLGHAPITTGGTWC